MRKSFSLIKRYALQESIVVSLELCSLLASQRSSEFRYVEYSVIVRFFRLSSVFQTREYNITITFFIFRRTKGAIASVLFTIISTCIVRPHTVAESHRSTYLCWFPARKNHANISWLAILLLCRWNGPTECTGHSCRTSIDEANIENVPLCTWTELIEQARAHI